MAIKKDLKIVLAGQKKFAIDLLDTLIKLPWANIAGIIADNNEKSFSQAAEKLNIKIFRLTDNLPDFDVGITAHLFSKIPDNLLAQANIGWLGYHPSPLPLYKGKKSIVQQIENKEKIVGGTLFWLNSEFDEGEIFSQEFVISNERKPLDLWINELAPLGLKLYIQALFDIRNGKIIKQKQWKLRS